MKILLISIASILSTLCDVEADPESSRSLRRRLPRNPLGGAGGGGSGGGGFKPSGDRLQAMVDEKCPSYDCKGETAETLDCTFEKPGGDRKLDSLLDSTSPDEDSSGDLTSPEEASSGDSTSPDEGMSGSDLKKFRKGKWKAQAMKCACCAKMSVEEILAARGEQGGSRPLGGGAGRPGGFGGGSRPEGGMGGSGGPIEGVHLEQVLAKKCPRFQEKCAAIEQAQQSVDCTGFDNTRGRFRDFLYCGCCGGD